jgi:hypothetical protein
LIRGIAHQHEDYREWESSRNRCSLERAETACVKQYCRDCAFSDCPEDPLSLRNIVLATGSEVIDDERPRV